MAAPATAAPFAQALGPYDEVEFYVYLYQGDPSQSPAPLLLPGEGVASYALALTPEAVAVGLTIVEDEDRAPVLTGNLIRLWLTIANGMQALPAFDAGVTVGVEVTVVTTADPSRTKKRTLLVRIATQ